MIVTGGASGQVYSSLPFSTGVGAFSLSHLIILFIAVVAGVFSAGLWLRWHDRRALERTLFYEVRALHSQCASMAAEIARRHKAGEALDESFFSLWRLSAPLIYPAVGFGLSRLGGDVLDRIGYFHAQLADARSRVAEARMAGAFQPSPYRILSSLVRAFYHVQPWLDSQERMDWALSEKADITHANALLSEFESSAKEPLAVVYCWVDMAYPQTPD